MAIMADPIFYHSIRRASGGKRRLIYITNSDPVDVTVTVEEMDKPEWVEIEGIYQGVELKLEKGKRTPFVVNINTEHQYFPTTKCMDEKVRVIFDNKKIMDVAISLPEVIDQILPFRGVFAVDYGTTNSVFSYKGRAMDIAHHAKASQAAVASDEIPSAIFFHNVEDSRNPRYSIGREALFDIKENSGRTYAYLISAKRRLGQNKSMLILDRMAGARNDHRQEYHVEEIASLVIRELVSRAEDEIGQKVSQVVATYPPMFSRAQKEALRRSFHKAMEAIGIELQDDSLIMDLDEANAGAFNYIYGPILDEFRDFDTTESKMDLLSLDFGGGTVDISLVNVNVDRNTTGRIAIETELNGLSGEPNWGGDNVTLEVFKMLKIAAALAASKARAAEIEAKLLATPDAAPDAFGGGGDDMWGAPAAPAAGGGDDMWGAPAAQPAASGGDDMWGGGGDSAAAVDDPWGDPSAEKKDVAATTDEDPEIAEIVNRDPQDAYEAALTTLANEAKVLERMISFDKPALDAVIDVEQEEGTFSGDDPARSRATVIESSIEIVLPTKFTEHEDVDPFKMEVARALFHELWHEADMLKIRMSASLNGKGKVTGVLKKAAKYSGVDPIIFNEVEFEIGQLNSRIEETVRKIVSKARQVYESVQSQGTEDLMIIGGEQTERPPLRVLLLGNCASLPVIQNTVNEMFGQDGMSVVFDKKNLKKAVANGAAEEYALRKEFGEKGLITYKPKGFLDRLPFALGIQHRDLALMGYPNGFCPIFERGAQIGAATVLDENSAFLIHEKMKDLAIFADYKDGGEPVYVGWIDFTEEADMSKIAAVPDDLSANPDNTMILAAKNVAPEGSFGVKFELVGNREIVATNLRTRSKHAIKPETEEWDKTRDPFSGIH